MQSPQDYLEKRYAKWLRAYRVAQTLLIANMGLIFLSVFTEWKSAYQFVYGNTTWPAMGITLVLTLMLSKAFHASHFYYALLVEKDSRR